MKEKNFVIQTGSNVLFEEIDIAKEFQNKFKSVVCRAPCETQMKYLGNPLLNSIMMHPVTEADVSSLLNDMSIRKATGSDGISVKIWKNNINTLAPILTVLINGILDCAIYPDVLKIAAITPVHKNGNKTDVNNYRAISLLPAINKLIEKITYEQFEGFILKYKQFDELQYGYRRNYGTQDALCKLFSIISRALDKNKFVVAVFFDISKAFDSLNHKMLLFKLQKMGIRDKALKLIEHYLTNRFQFVRINDERSDSSPIRNGVPQGSNLGPLLFNMMLYDLKFVSTTSTIIKYADDIVLLKTCDKSTDFVEDLKNDINEIKSYYADNGFQINLNKSKYMTFGFKASRCLGEFMDVNKIENVEKLKYLGIILDSRLKLDEQADALIKKLSQSVNAMTIIKHHLPTQSMLLFYNAFIGSQFFYSGFLLCRMTNDDINRLQRFQNKSLKIAYNLERRFSTYDLFMKVATNILPITGIAYLNLLLLVKKNLLSKQENGEFEVIQQGRRKQQLKFQRYSKNILARDFLCLGPTVYNQLPLKIREIQNFYQFKRKLKTYLMEHKQVFLRGNQLNVNKMFST